MTLHLSRRTPRRILAAALGLSLAVGLAACSSDNNSDNSDSVTSSASIGSTDSTTAPEGYYPHTQETHYGDVSIKEQPERVVALTITAADQLISLGITPIAVATLGGDKSKALENSPWLAGKIEDKIHPELLKDGKADPEAIAKMNPDLIIGEKYTFPDKETWDKVNLIAPAILPTYPDSSARSIDWRDSLRSTAEPLGLTDKSAAIISDIEDKYRSSGLPEGKFTYNYMVFTNDEFSYGNGGPLDMLGLSASPNQKNSVSGNTLSLENVNQIDGDLVIILATPQQQKDKLTSDRNFNDLEQTKRGSVLFAEFSEGAALNGGGPLALQWLLPRITPTIEKLK
ncbi:MAG: ABC transporter substrate-binding protein [Corynebacterium variabile]|uniref:ABC transporter substrate-binding protein n=2 Tax=Corynebacterium variabile TaxID=1727 RepID=UPI003F90F74A